MRNIPNILSTIRLGLVGIYVWLFLAGKYLPALCVFVTAFFTDILDGWLARRFGWITNLGKLLDPLADKLMTIAALVCIYIGKHKTIYLVLFLMAFIKELLMLIGGVFMMKRNVVAFASWPGKVATGMFAIGVALSLLSFLPFPRPIEPWNMIVLIIATILSYYALIFYATHQLPDAFHRRNLQTEKKNQVAD